MPLEPKVYGNLQSYKLYVLPTAKRLFGSYSFRRKAAIKHHYNVQKMLEVLALNGPLTTWGMAKIVLDNEVSGIRTKEKEYRRLLKGRKDRGKRSPGVLDIGLVVIEGKNYNRGPSDTYRLSVHGILYCLDVLEFTDKEIDTMAKHYVHVLPWIFGKWDYLKSIVGKDVYRLKTLAGGIFLDNIQVTKLSKFPVFELLTYLSIKYQEYFESIEEKKLAEQLSCWFYTHLFLPTGTKLPTAENSKLKKIFADSEIKSWFYGFVEESIAYYQDRFTIIKKIGKM
jgi:hypothetical protein